MVIIILCFVINFYVIHENSFEYFIFQKEGGMMQACWQTLDSLMTFKVLLTLLWGIHSVFMVILHTL